MKELFNSLSFRLPLTLLVLLILMCVSEYGIIVLVAEPVSSRLTQLLNVQLARQITERLGPYFADPSADFSVAQQLIHELVEMNPTIDPYFVDAEGNILADFGEIGVITRKKVRVGPILVFLSPQRDTLFPLYGDDPRNL